MARDLGQSIRQRQTVASNDRRLNTVAQRAVAARSDNAPISGIYLGTVAEVLTADAGGIQRYKITLLGGHAKAATGLDVEPAVIADDNGAGLSVDQGVIVYVPPTPGPAIIISSHDATYDYVGGFSASRVSDGYDGGVRTVFDGA